MSTLQTPAGAGALQPQTHTYTLQGTLLEACSCDILCPCWVGENPDNGTCDGMVAYHFDHGEIDGIDVSDLNVVGVAHIPGNVMTPNSWKIAFFVDERATDEQMNALFDAFTGKLGGPLADLAQFFGEVLGVERIPISHEVHQGTGELRAGEYVSAEMAPFRSADGTITTLRDTIISTIPGSPAYVSRAAYNRVNIPKYGFNWSFEGRNAIQGDYRIAYP